MNDDRWTRILSGELSLQESSHLLETTLDDLATRLSQVPEISETAIRVTEHALKEPLTEQSWSGFIDAFSNILGSGAANLLGWISYADVEERTDQVAAMADPGVSFLVRELTALFGADLRRSMNLAFEWPNDWSSGTFYVFSELRTGAQKVRVELTKHNGEELVLETSADSLLLLVTNCAEALSTLGEDARFSPATVDRFRATLPAVQTLLDSRMTPDAKLQDSSDKAID